MADEEPTTERPRASERLAAAVGRPAPAPLTRIQLQKLEAAQDQADAEAERIWGIRRMDAA